LYVAVWVERERCGHQSTHATRERHERIENPLSASTVSRRPSSIETVDRIAVFREHQDEPSSATTY
jgi:hypothetical protein